MKGQNCGCDITLNNLTTNSLNLIWGNNLNYSPGDTICIPAGTYRGIRFYDLVGTETQPITIKNCGGQVTFNEVQYSAVSFQRSQYIHFTGTGDSGTPYGFYIGDTGGGSAGVYVENLSSDVEIDHIEVAYAGFAGIMAKTDPSCSKPDTWRSNGFILKNLKIHHNYIHHTGGEGIYIGFTGGYKIKSNRSCSGTPIFGHWLEDVYVHNNILEDIAWDGIQLNLVRENAQVYDNTLIRYGTANKYYQDFAFSIGGGVYEIFNNTVINESGGTGQGMQFISADSGTKVYNNLIVNPDFHGIFMHQRHEFEDPNEGYYVANNTIVEPEKSGTFYNTVITITDDPAKKYQTQGGTPTYFVNNLVVDPGNDYANGNTWKQDQESYFDFNKRATRDSINPLIYTNIMTRDADTLGLADIPNLDYRPGSGSSAVVDQGSDLSSWGILIDLDNTSRPQGSGFDIGAFEWISAVSAQAFLDPDLIPAENPETEDVILYPNPAPSGLFELKVSDYFSSNTVLRIRNSSGQLLYNDLLANYRRSAPPLKRGLYFVDIEDNSQKVTKKLLVQ